MWIYARHVFDEITDLRYLSIFHIFWSWTHGIYARHVFVDITNLWYSDCMSRILSWWFCVELPWGGSRFWYCLARGCLFDDALAWDYLLILFWHWGCHGWPCGLVLMCPGHLVLGVGWDLRSLNDAYDEGIGLGALPWGEIPLKYWSMGLAELLSLGVEVT